MTQMLKTAAKTLILLLTLHTYTQAQTLKTPAGSPLQTIKQAFGLSDITIEYCRPSAKGRIVFGDVVPFDKIWRTGANGSTKITFGDDVTIEGKAIKAGTYAIYTLPNKANWDIMLYSDTKLGGNVSDYKVENEVARFKAEPIQTQDKTETFTIEFANITPTSVNIDLVWEKTRVGLTVKTEIDTKIMANIESVMNTDSRPYYQAASYYYENNKDLNKALTWVTKATELNPKAYWVWGLKAKIHSKLNDKKGALAAAQQTLSLAQAEEDGAYIKIAEKIINENK
jgi:hypothetical protein